MLNSRKLQLHQTVEYGERVTGNLEGVEQPLDPEKASVGSGSGRRTATGGDRVGGGDKALGWWCGRQAHG